MVPNKKDRVVKARYAQIKLVRKTKVYVYIPYTYFPDGPAAGNSLG